MDRVTPKAIQYIENFVVKDRRRVHAYHNLLWVWHRLDEGRWKSSSLPMRTGRKRTSKLEVDHTIADAWWQRRVNLETEERLKTLVGTEIEKLTVSPEGYDSLWKDQGLVNLLGNCSLLDKSFNISKSDNSICFFIR